MNEQMFEYIRLREQLRQLQQRQGDAAWLIIERVIRDLSPPVLEQDLDQRRRQLRELIGKIDQKEPIK